MHADLQEVGFSALPAHGVIQQADHILPQEPDIPPTPDVTGLPSVAHSSVALCGMQCPPPLD